MPSENPLKELEQWVSLVQKEHGLTNAQIVILLAQIAGYWSERVDVMDVK